MIMDASREKISQVLSLIGGKDDAVLSRATSPGGEEPRDSKGNNGVERSRPRTYPYFQYLPYDVEDCAQRQQNLDEILKLLYVAVEAGDFSPGAVHWTREIKNWLSLKFDPTKEQRIKMVRLYYELALAPGIDAATAERFSNMFMSLTK